MSNHEMAATRASEADPHRNGPPHQLEGRRILILDEGSKQASPIMEAFQSAGASVSFVADSHLALAKVVEALKASRPYDLVLLAMQTRRFDGYCATRSLRERGYRGAILALTGTNLDQDRDKCLTAGCNDVTGNFTDVWELLALAHRLILTQVGDTPDGRSLAKSGPEPSATEDRVERFSTQLPRQMEAIQAAMRDQDLGALEDLIGHVKRAAGRHGYVPISRRAAAFETLLQQTNAKAAALERAIRELGELCHQATTDLNDLGARP